MFTEWFNTTCGVKQGDNLSPTVFSMFINDLVHNLNLLNNGINIDNQNICCLLYADDIVLFSENKAELQRQLDVVHSWAETWEMSVNIDKTKVVHFRKKRARQTDFNFKLGE